MNAVIELKSMKFYAFHGVAPQERAVGNRFVVDVWLMADIGQAAETDCLDDTIDYAAVYAVVKEEMAQPSQLLEAVAGRILRALRGRFPRILQAKVSIAKRNPPFGGDVESAVVTLEG